MDDLPAVLVVEDETLIRMAMMEALQEGGYVVLEAHDGASAIKHIETVEQLRGLVTDIRMGSGPDGWEVAHRARERFPALPIVYVTGDSASDWAANGVPLSVVLEKPFVNAELIAALANQAINRPSSGSA
jgi:CheY-like chemotaxis protein